MKYLSFDTLTGRQAVWTQMDIELRELIDPISGKLRKDLSQEVPCPVCESIDFKFLFTKTGFEFVRCIKCDTIYVNPQLRAEAILNYYGKKHLDDNQKTSSSMWMDVLTNPNNQAWQRPYFREALGILARYISPQGSILDIGCSIGLFIEIAKEYSFQCIGLEIEPEAANYALSRGLDVRCQTLDEACFPQNTFDAVTMFGVLEHLQQPKAVLRQIWHCLKPGGAVMAIVPNVYSLLAMILQDQARMFNGRNHLTYFSSKTLRTIFEHAGFIIQHEDTCLTALDSILNYMQFSDPQEVLTLKHLPRKLQQLLEKPEGRQKVETLIYEFDLGLRLRIVSTKPL